MRKLQILKAIVDFIWILWCIPSAILLILFIYFSFSSPESINVFLDFEKDAVDFSDLSVKLFLFVFIILFYVCFYCFYLFRKTIRYFQQVKPFHVDVIKNYYKIGYLLSIVGLTATILLPLSRLIIQNKIKLTLGVTPYLGIMCLGLFFMVLSEVFKVAKHAKEENELTI
ncbi:MAG: DUF2975 domain-containing protein [Winogradskyella sp.]|uniref:DUF2975 domain-containing protein n=1 Tax=Winogradskyella sp. TaxID=1883156 RepID=UPI0017E9B4F1|nr:DUF2975 domain-containing protein [Winogradskyella sp.]MBT8244597.1 DUF2975 domain-containing protein [Winogradskyella sp.]NNK22673.1 DUF2975 domain-containing protein [Winogradskyella sp.]